MSGPWRRKQKHSVCARPRRGRTAFSPAQFLITKPLCLRVSDVAILEQALRLYQGRALYDGPLSEEVLAGLAKKYGLIY